MDIFYALCDLLLLLVQSAAMEVSGAPADVLQQRPWLPVSIDGCHVLAKSWFGETAYHVLLMDMNCVWEERMHSAAIQSRAQVCTYLEMILRI